MPDNTSATLVESQSPTRLFRQTRKGNLRHVGSVKVKQNIIAVFEGLGGWENMLAWARSHQDVFYGQIYPKLLPTEGYQPGSGSIRVLVYAPNGQQPEVLGIKTNDEQLDAESDLSPG